MNLEVGLQARGCTTETPNLRPDCEALALSPRSSQALKASLNRTLQGRNKATLLILLQSPNPELGYPSE